MPRQCNGGERGHSAHSTSEGMHHDRDTCGEDNRRYGVGGVRRRPVAGRHRRPRLRPAQPRAVRGRRFLPCGSDRAHHRRVAEAARHVPAGAGPGRVRRGHPYPVADRRVRARLHRRGAGADRRPADRRPAQACHHAGRRLADGRGRPRGVRVRGRPGGQGDLHPAAQDPQRRRLRRVHPRDPRLPLRGHHHRPARRLRPGPHHR